MSLQSSLETNVGSAVKVLAQLTGFEDATLCNAEMVTWAVFGLPVTKPTS